MTGGDIASIALSWCGTPYHHQASVKGIGCDCLGLLRGVYREAIGPEPETAPNYSPSWDEVSMREDMLNMANRHLCQVDDGDRGAGLVLVFRMRPRFVAKHCGIMTGAGAFVHSHSGRGTVEIELSDWWENKIAGVFVFPGVK